MLMLLAVCYYIGNNLFVGSKLNVDFVGCRFLLQCGVAFVIYCTTSLQLHEVNKWMSFLAVYKRFTQMLKDFVIWRAWFYSIEDVAESHAFLYTL